MDLTRCARCRSDDYVVLLAHENFHWFNHALVSLCGTCAVAFDLTDGWVMTSEDVDPETPERPEPSAVPWY